MSTDDHQAPLREKLSPEAFHITQEGGTERAFTGPYWDYKGAGVYHCICCDAALFDAKTQYSSGTGWPSFFAPINDDCLNERIDKRLFRTRTEILCRACDAHLGHVFDDGPEPTGLRYCINGHALSLKA